MNPDLQWFIGILSGATGVFSAVLVATFRNLSTKMSTSSATLHEKIREGEKEITKAIDDVKEKYVRRDDWNDHMERLDKMIKEVRDEQKAQGDEQRTQHLKVLEAISLAASQR